jgi:DNA-binding transcriptional LysR family regulator
MNFTTMDYFVAVAEERSFTKAAERLSVTQQTLSAHIAGVERELGVRLVNRKVPLTLTYAGNVFLGYARSFQAQERSMRQEFQDIAGDERGLLGVGVASTRGHMIMPRAIAEFQAAHPGINVLLHEGENRELVTDLKEGRIDIAIATVAEDEPGLVVHRLYADRVVLLLSNELLARLYGDRAEEVVASVGREGSLAPLASCPFMMLGQGDEPGDLARRLLEHSGVKPWERVQSSNSETLVDLAIRGVGACFVPLDLAQAAAREEGGQTLRCVDLGPQGSIPICAAWRDSKHVWSVVEAFYRLLLSQLARSEEGPAPWGERVVAPDAGAREQGGQA